MKIYFDNKIVYLIYFIIWLQTWMEVFDCALKYVSKVSPKD